MTAQGGEGPGMLVLQDMLCEMKGNGMNSNDSGKQRGCVFVYGGCGEKV